MRSADRLPQDYFRLDGSFRFPGDPWFWGYKTPKFDPIFRSGGVSLLDDNPG